MAWIILGLAGLCEVGFTTAMKYADGFTKLMPSLVFAVLYIASATPPPRSTHHGCNTGAIGRSVAAIAASVSRSAAASTFINWHVNSGSACHS